MQKTHIVFLVQWDSRSHPSHCWPTNGFLHWSAMRGQGARLPAQLGQRVRLLVVQLQDLAIQEQHQTLQELPEFQRLAMDERWQPLLVPGQRAAGPTTARQPLFMDLVGVCARYS